jgi:predicted nucleic acid-binding protein
MRPHLKDVEYFALALKLDCPIWSNEKAFKKQSRVKVISTKELISFLSQTWT